MATKTKSGQLEDHITCSICFEIYRDPHALPCLHTFCLQCIKKIHEDTTIQCPECREFTNLKVVKRDFKTQALLEFHKRSSRTELDMEDVDLTGLSTSTTTAYEDILLIRKPIPSHCEMCEDKTKALVSKCRECDQFMCGGCDSVHQNIKTCKAHTVTPVQHFIQTLQTNLRHKTGLLEKEQMNLRKNSNSLDKSLKTIDGLQDEQLGLVDRNLDQLIKRANEHRKNMHSLIKDTNSQLRQTLSSKNQMFKINQRELQTKIEHLRECFRSEDLCELLGTVKSTDEQINKDVEKIQREIQKSTDIFVKSPIKITIGEEVDLDALINVKVHDITKVSYCDIPDRTYKLVTSESLSCSNPRRIRLINDELWCAGYDGIYIYSTDCQMLGKIKHEHLKNVYSVVQTPSGHIIAACLANGLHLIDSKGNYLKQIASGKFSDVCCKDNYVYTLDVETCKLLVFGQQEQKPNTAAAANPKANIITWVEVNEFSVSHGKCSHDSRVSVHHHGISISSYNSQSLFLYSHDGNFKYQMSSNERHRLSPLMCDTDSEGNVLIANHQNHKILVYKVDRTWEELSLPEVNYPIDVAMDFSCMYVVNYRQKVLLKFSFK